MFTRNFKMYEWYEFTYKWRISLNELVLILVILEGLIQKKRIYNYELIRTQLSGSHVYTKIF